MKKVNLKKQAEEIYKRAEELGAEKNFLFMTTFRRYEVQITLLQQLEEEIQNSGLVCKKEYVKGRENIYTSPAVSEYNKTSTAANQTAATLIKILESLKNQDANQNKKSKLAELMAE